jgi:hypothetical protein
MRPTSNMSGVVMVGVVLITAWAAACSGGTEPRPAEIRVEAITAIALTGTVGAEVQPVPTVRVTDETDRPMAGVVVTFKVASWSGAIPAGTVITDADGTAAVGAWTLGPVAGSQTLTAGAGGRADVVFAATAAAGPLAVITPVSGDEQIVGVGEGLAQPLVARAADAFGNPLAGVPIAFTVTSGGGTLEGGAVVTGSDGLAASGVWTLGAEPGVQQASAAAGVAQATFRAHALAPLVPLQGRIAFVSVADPSIDIATVNADGSGFDRLTKPGVDLQPAWSPDGGRLVMANDDQESAVALYTMAPDGASRTRVTDGPIDLDPAWSPDGSTIAFSTLWDHGGGQIAALNTADGVVTILVDDPGYNGQPAWSPDGRQLAFVSDWATFDWALDIYTVNADGTGRRQLTFGSRTTSPSIPNNYLHPAWSPDGSMIAFVYGSAIRPGDVRFTIAIMSPTGVILKDLAWAGDIDLLSLSDPGSLTWSPDGRVIAYSFVDCDLVTMLGCSRERSVRYVSLDGRYEGTIVTDAHSPAWH